jgi:alkylation response protein AidB-like acyl-CoA dehydrogenase
VDFSIPKELIELKEVARTFVTRELAPFEEQVDRDDDIDPCKLRELRLMAAKIGLCGFNLPRELGGGGVGPLGEVLVGEEVGRTSMPLAEVVGRLPRSLIFADRQQVEWLVRPTLCGDKTVCIALTEPNAGSDLQGVKTKAVRESDGWRLNGSKQFISNAETSDFIIVLAVTDPGAPIRRRFTTFIVERPSNGLHISRRFRKMGWHGYHISAFSLDNCLIPTDHVLGEVGGGFDTIMESVNTTRLYIAARCVGAAQDLLRRSINYAVTRRTFGSRLGDHQAIQFMLANMDVELEAARLLALAAAWKGEAYAADFRISVSRAKLYATEMAGRVADSAVQILGGAGFMSDSPVERMYRDLRGFRIGEGSSEMQRIQIARYLLARR